MSDPVQISTAAIDAALDQFFSKGKSRLTIESYRADLVVFRKFMRTSSPAEALLRLVELGEQGAGERAQKFRDWRRCSPKSRNRRLSALRGAVGALKTAGLIQWELRVTNLKVDAAIVTSAPGLETVRLILARASKDTTPAGRRNYAMIRILAETALNRGEIRSLAVAGFDDLHQTLKVGRTKTVSISRVTADAIKAWLIVKPSGLNGALFENLMRGRAGRLTGSAIRSIVIATAKRVGGKVGPRSLRKASIEKALDNAEKNQISEADLQAFTGHKDPTMLGRYMKKDRQRDRQSVPIPNVLFD